MFLHNHKFRKPTAKRRSSSLVFAALFVVVAMANDVCSIEPFVPYSGENCQTCRYPNTVARQYALQPLPPVCEPPPRLTDQQRNALFPCSSCAPEESALFEFPQVTRPLSSPLLPGPTPPSPPQTSPKRSPGFQRDLGRFTLLAPVAPGVVSAHAPPWEQLPSPSEHPGQLVKAMPHHHDAWGCEMNFTSQDFSPNPYAFDYDVNEELGIYGGKFINPIQRPLVEWGLPLYDKGPIPRSGTQFGATNLAQPQFTVYGDYRTALAYNQNVANEQTVWANRINLDFDLQLTATERIHAFWGPLDEGQSFSGFIYDDGDISYNNAYDAWDARTDTLFFEGDLGAILGGLGGFYPQLDLPFAVGLIPLVFQNGIWIEDAFVGAAATIPARNNPVLDWSNYDTTFFIGFDEVTSNLAFQGDNEAANIIGFTTFIERRRGYLELGYAFLDDTAELGRSYHNIACSYTRRYLNLVSNSVRAIVSTGQGGPRDDRTADGLLLLVENSFLTRNPYNVIPYANFFAGFGTPQSAARLQGPLRNTGINFESDLLTGYPILDDSANDTYGGAIGIDLLGGSFQQQLILEAAFLQTMNNDASRIAPGDQYAVGMRFQRPLSHTLLFRADAIYGWLENSDDIAGVRTELRRKF